MSTRALNYSMFGALTVGLFYFLFCLYCEYDPEVNAIALNYSMFGALTVGLFYFLFCLYCEYDPEVNAIALNYSMFGALTVGLFYFLFCLYCEYDPEVNAIALNYSMFGALTVGLFYFLFCLYCEYDPEVNAIALNYSMFGALTVGLFYFLFCLYCEYDPEVNAIALNYSMFGALTVGLFYFLFCLYCEYDPEVNAIALNYSMFGALTVGLFYFLFCLYCEYDPEVNAIALNYSMFGALTVGLFYFLFCLYYAARRLEVDDWNLRESQFRNQMWVKDPVLKTIHERMVENADVMSPEVTIITAYFNIGSLNKGGPFGVYTPEKYIRWMSVFGRIENPVIVFTDSQEVKHIFQELRKKFPPERTQIHVIKRESLWSFRLAPEIKAVFSQPNYPNHDPNTVHENYSCVMHAKFELVNKVIREELFHTQYLAWMDVGLFRGVVDEKRYPFPLVVPHDFDVRKVAYSGQSTFNPSLTPMQIVAGNKVWVGGAMFLARPEILYIYTQDYLTAVRRLLEMKIMSTDQQVIYIMYLPSFDFKPRVEIQTYTTHGEDDWFYLGYMLKDVWDTSLRGAEPAARFLLSVMT